MSSLYKDAIADARKLREAAEQNAKNRIIEAVTPKLRKLIERQIQEGDEFVEDSELDDLVDAEDAMDMMDDDFDETPGAEPMDLAPEPMDVDSDGLGSIEVIPDDFSFDASDDEDDDEDSEDGDTNKSVHVNITVEGKKNFALRQRAVRLVKALSEAKNRKQRNKIRKQLRILRDALIITENSQNIRLAKNIKVILKESTMRRRKNSWLFEGKDGADSEEVEFDDAGFDEEGDEGDEDLDVAAIKDAVADLASAVGMDVEDSEMDDEDLEDEEDLEDDELDMDMEDEDMDDDLGDEGVGYEYGGIAESDGDECDAGDEDDEVEINEAMLRRALSSARRRTSSRRTHRRISETKAIRARRARIARRRRQLREGEAKAMASSFGGGKAGKEMFVDVDENTLLNALAEELGNPSNATQAKGKASAKASDFGGGSIKKGAVMEVRKANKRAKLAERKAIAAQKELKESNLFNAKLLYVTKLMQQHNLNNKQQRAIIEAMDNAKTQREAKLLFSSLNESLNKRATEKKAAETKKLNENVSRTGTSSRSLRSGQAPNNSGVELDRWAVLAGLKK